MSDVFSPVYKRVLIKLSGEALSEGAAPGEILNDAFLSKIAGIIRRCVESGVQIGIVIGGGNIWRGRKTDKMDKCRADYMGMLATAINCLAMQDTLEQTGIPAKVLTAIEMKECAEYFTPAKANALLDKNEVVIFGCGTGSPFFSTDTAAVLRAVEIGADVVLMSKKIDGVYSADPKSDPTAVKYDELSYSEYLSKGLKAMDATAASLSRDNHLSILFFGLNDPENIVRALKGEKIGTLLK